MSDYKLFISSQFDLEEAWQILSNEGLQILYSEEEGKEKFLVVRLEHRISFKAFPFIEKVEDFVLPSVDWESQWQTHCPNYQDGTMLLDLNGKSEIQLLPGPGFGDLSHPTTRLVLKLMEKYIEDKNVLDVGCGSGILAIAAVAQGAKQVWAIDIDEGAIEHTQKNVCLNDFEDRIHVCLPIDLPKEMDQVVVLMNMIQSEQVEAWRSLIPWHHKFSFLITSGVLIQEREKYLSLCRSWGFHLVDEVEEQGWLGVIHVKKEGL